MIQRIESPCYATIVSILNVLWANFGLFNFISVYSSGFDTFVSKEMFCVRFSTTSCFLADDTCAAYSCHVVIRSLSVTIADFGRRLGINLFLSHSAVF